MTKTTAGLLPYFTHSLFFAMTLLACDDAADVSNDPGSDEARDSQTDGSEHASGGTSSSTASPTEQHHACIEAGKCVATKIAYGLTNVSTIAVSPTARWVSSDKGVTRIDNAGMKTFSNMDGFAQGMATVGEIVFWHTSSSLYAMAPGKAEEPLISADDSRDAPTSLVASGSRVWFLRRDTAVWIDPTTATTGDVYLGGDSSAYGHHPNALAVDGSDLYWTDGSLYNPMLVRSMVGGTKTTLAEIEGAQKAFAIVVTKSHVILSDYSNRKIVAVPKKGGKPAIVADARDDAFSMVSDESGVYWTTFHGVMMCATDGTNAHLLLAHPSTSINVASIAVSPDAIYIADPGPGAVFEIKK